jgi:predicted house-cleaning NTP pyrophosphatase (Maf/HAM1 superfamily)
MDRARFVLGSRSPRRLELLQQIHPAELIDVVPPSTTDEAGFAELHDWPSIERRLREVAQTKCDDVAAQVRKKLGEFADRARFSDPDGRAPSPPSPLPQGERGGDYGAPEDYRTLRNHRAPREENADSLSPLSPRGRGAGGEGAYADSPAPIVIAADTVVIVNRGGSLHVLGQPPDDESWREPVRRWFREDYAGKTHLVATALVLEHVASGKRASRVVTSRVTFIDNVDRWLDWYLEAGESRGKAGGYALQGAGSIFISKVEGSLSNVVGLPLAEVLEMLSGLLP